MDQKPFLAFNLLEFYDTIKSEISKFVNAYFNLKGVLSSVSYLKQSCEIK